MGVRKAVFPVAGLGTRFLPATKAVPKELLPVLEKPLIQYAIEEACEAGIDTIILVTRGDKPSILRHLSPDPELESFLSSRNNHEMLERIRAIVPAGIRILEAVQAEPLGLGHAVLCARELVGDEPFAVILPDDLIRSTGPGALSQMVELHRRTGHSVVAVEEVPREALRRYGVVGLERNGRGEFEIQEIVEKPEPEAAPSNLGVVGRYILSGAIFPLLESLGAGAGGEIQLTDGIARLLRLERVLAHAFEGDRFDCGSRLGLILASIEYALADERLAPELSAYLARRRESGRGGEA